MKGDNGPLVSVVICTYNRRDLLQRCLLSLLEQTHPKDDYEIIVVDDGSTDGTADLLQELARSSDRALRCFRQENQGSATARNLGIAMAGGEIIASIDERTIVFESASWP